MKSKFLPLVFLLPASTVFAANGTWTNLAGGGWGTAGNWSASTIASGADFTAYFNTLDLTSNLAITMGGARTVGHLNFGDTDTATAFGWTLSGAAQTLTLSVTSGTPTITVGALGGTSTATISTNIASTAGLTKLGAGILDLQPATGNTITGITTISAGSIYFRNSNAFGGTTSIALDGSTTELRNTNTAVTLATAITIGATGDIKTLGSTITGTIFSGGITINEETSGNFVINPQSTSVMTISGNIVGSGGAGIKKTGTSSVLILSGNNSYSGDTMVTGGTLRAGSTTAIANGTGKGNLSITGSTTAFDLNGFSNTINGLSGSVGYVENNATSTSATLTLGAGDVDGSIFSGTIRDNNGTGGSIALLKTGIGAQTLGAINSFTGGTIIQAGRINASSSGALGSGTIQLDGTGAQLRLSATGVNLSNALTITNTGNLKTLSAFAVGGSTTYSGNITVNETSAGNFSVQVGDSHTLNISGNILGSNAVGLTKTSAGTLTLSGSNSYTGPNAINQGTINANTTTALGSTSNSLSIGNNNTAAGSTSTLNVGANLTIGTLSSTAMSTPSSGTNGIQINIQTGNTLTINQVADATYAGDLTGAGQLTLGSASTNKLILTSNNNSYTGATTLNAGTLLVNGSLGDTAVTVGSGATLGGSGTIGTTSVLNTTTINGTLAPGNSPGILTINDNLQFGSGGTLLMQIDGTTAGTNYDQVVLNGSGTLAGTLTLAWQLLSPASNGTILTLISNDGSDLFSGTFNYAEGATVTDNLGGSWHLSYVGNSGNDLVLTAVPEPTATLLGGIGLLCLIRRRR